ncbi:MAG TPA: tetratricopeptide repeat protein [Rubrivivax sp.]|nr:tetratricopeptide repeat protein [Rubrivivax sp.]
MTITGAVVASLATVIAFSVDDEEANLALSEFESSSPEPALAPAPAPAIRPGEAVRADAPAPLHPAAHPNLPQRAERGDAQAQSSLAIAYLYGQGVAKDVRLARQWAEKAALQGNAEGQYVLGLISLAGLGVLQNFQTAIQWFEKAAQQNHAEAQYRLGVIHQKGYGVDVDKTKAHFWFNLAAAQGQLEATAARDRLMPIMTAEQIDAAQRQALAWRPSAAKP